MKAASIRNAAAILAIALIAGCAEANTVIIGKKRAAISPEHVQLYSVVPQRPYQAIALINASSGKGWTAQQSMEYAVVELKNLAAAVGANGIILGQSGSQKGRYVEKTASGTAIYLSRE